MPLTFDDDLVPSLFKVTEEMTLSYYESYSGNNYPAWNNELLILVTSQIDPRAVLITYGRTVTTKLYYNKTQILSDIGDQFIIIATLPEEASLNLDIMTDLQLEKVLSIELRNYEHASITKEKILYQLNDIVNFT